MVLNWGAGHIGAGESEIAALDREVMEETGPAAKMERLVSVNSDPAFQVVTYPNGRRVHFVTALFSCRVAGGFLRGSSEGTEWEWFAPGGLPEPLLPYARVWLADAASGTAVGPVIR